MTGYRWDPADPDGAAEITAMLGQAGAAWDWPEHNGAAAILTIHHLGSRMAARPGDMIVRDSRGVHVQPEPPQVPDVRLRRIAEEDGPLLVKWRNENAKYFPPQPDWTVQSQAAWFRQVHRYDPCDNQFMVEYRGRPVGTLAITICEGRGELEKMILGDKTLARAGIMRAAFRQLMDAYRLDQYWLRIYPWNEATIAFHKRNGFTVAGGSGEYLVMERDGLEPWPDDPPPAMPPPVMSRVPDDDGDPG